MYVKRDASAAVSAIRGLHCRSPRAFCRISTIYADPSVGAHKMALRHNSKSLRDELNSSRSDLIIRATFTPSERTSEPSVSNEDPQADVARRERGAKARVGRTRETRAQLEQQLKV